MTTSDEGGSPMMDTDEEFIAYLNTLGSIADAQLAKADDTDGN